MAGYIGSKASVTQVDGYNRAEADAEFVQTAGDTMTGELTATAVNVAGSVTANQFVGGGAIITAGELADGNNYSTGSTSYTTASRFEVTPSSATSRLMGWVFCQMRATGSAADGDTGSTARVHYLDSSGSWISASNLAQNLQTMTGTEVTTQEVPATFTFELGQLNLNASGKWDIAIRHYEVYDATSAIDDARLLYMEYEP